MASPPLAACQWFRSVTAHVGLCLAWSDMGLLPSNHYQLVDSCHSRQAASNGIPASGGVLVAQKETARVKLIPNIFWRLVSSQNLLVAINLTTILGGELARDSDLASGDRRSQNFRVSGYGVTL